MESFKLIYGYKVTKGSYLDKIIEIEIIPVTEAEIINTIQSFKIKNFSGYDAFSSKIIRYCVLEIGKPLRHVHNSSLQSGIYPERFKYLIARPIYIHVIKVIRQITNLHQ